MGRLVLLVTIILLSATMSCGIRTAGMVGTGGAPGTAVAATTQAAAGQVATPLVATAAAGTTASSSEQQAPLDDDPYKESKRKVPNGPDPIHNRRARWGEAPAESVEELRSKERAHQCTLDGKFPSTATSRRAVDVDPW